MIKCSSAKRVYVTENLAEDALLEAHANFSYGKGQGPVAVYRCDDCGYFHLTSKGEMNPRLAKEMKEGKLGLEKEARHWLRKIK